METISIALLCSVLGASLSFLSFQRNGRKETEDRVKRETKNEAQLDYIQKGIDEVRFNDRVRDEQLKNMNDRLIIIENETRVLFKRCDKLDKILDLKRGE